MNRLLIFILWFLFISPVTGTGQDQKNRSIEGKTLIAFGSCSKQNISNQRWHEVLNHDPGLWIWLGDNIYADTHDMNLMAEMYERQKSYPGYRQLLRSDTEIIGTWDDHDYGVNDGGRHFSKKDESKALMIDFLDIGEENPIHDHKGVYQSYDFLFGEHELKVILLDTRYFRDTIYRDPVTRAYLPNRTGDILGEAQWKWLENEMRNSLADLHIIGSSIQVIPEDHRFEKWANFPRSRERLFDLLEKYPDKKVMIISGDRHIAEISRLDLQGLNYPLYDFTSSGLTHSYEHASEANRHRVSDLITLLNFGLIEIDWQEGEALKVDFRIMGEGDKLLYEYSTVL